MTAIYRLFLNMSMTIKKDDDMIAIHHAAAIMSGASSPWSVR